MATVFRSIVDASIVVTADLAANFRYFEVRVWEDGEDKEKAEIFQEEAEGSGPYNIFLPRAYRQSVGDIWFCEVRIVNDDDQISEWVQDTDTFPGPNRVEVQQKEGGYSLVDYVTRDGLRELYGPWDAGEDITAPQFHSDVGGGTPPLTVVSTTLVSNLNADMVDGVHEAAFSLADGTRNFTGVVGGVDPTASNHLATKEYVDQAVSFIAEYYYNDTASDIGGIYYDMQEQQTGEAQSTFPTGPLGAGDGQALTNWATIVGVPGVTNFKAGTYVGHIHAAKTAGTKPVTMYFELYTRTSGGVETLRATSESTGLITAVNTGYEIHANVVTDVDILSTDRIIIKWLADVGVAGSNATITLYAEGNNNSVLEIPTSTEVLSSVFVRQDGTTPLSAPWDAEQNITAPEFIGNVTAEWVQFDTSFADGVEEGRVQWNSEDGTLEYGLPGGNVNLQVGQEVLVKATNKSGVTIPNGACVYVDGAQGSRPTIALARADDESTAASLAIATEEILDNASGYVTVIGLVRDVDTAGMAAGSVLYLSPTTAGEYTTTRPTAPDYKVFMGYVLFENASSGIIIVGPIVQPTLMNLSDVFEEVPADNDILQWDAADSRFELTDSPVIEGVLTVLDELNLVGNTLYFGEIAQSISDQGDYIAIWDQVTDYHKFYTAGVNAGDYHAVGTVQAEHLYSTDDLEVDGLATIGESLTVDGSASFIKVMDSVTYSSFINLEANSTPLVTLRGHGANASGGIRWQDGAGNNEWRIETNAVFGTGLEFIENTTLRMYIAPGGDIEMTSSLDIDDDLSVGGAASSPSFSSGVFGDGWRIAEVNSEWAGEFDRMTVRGTLSAFVFKKHIVQASNSLLLITDSVKLDDDITVGQTVIDVVENTLAANDVVLIQDEIGGNIFREIITVTSVDGDELTVTRAVVGAAKAWPGGTVLTRIGNTATAARQGSILLDAGTDHAPFIDILGVDDTSDFSSTYTDSVTDAIAKVKVRLGQLSGITDSDVGLSGSNEFGMYASNVYLKGRLRASIMDTAASGQRLVVDGSTNRFLVYDSADDLKIQMGDFGGSNFGLHIIGTNTGLQVDADALFGGYTQVNGGRFDALSSAYIQSDKVSSPPTVDFYVGAEDSLDFEIVSGGGVFTVTTVGSGDGNVLAMTEVFAQFGGYLIVGGYAVPSVDSTHDLGLTDVRWATVYADDGDFSDDLTVGGDIFMAEYQYHISDPNTYIRVESDSWKLYAGGVQLFHADTNKFRFLQNAGAINATFFESVPEGVTPEVRITGYRTGDAARILQIGVGVDAADTASFDGLSNYLFDGSMLIGSTDGDNIRVLHSGGTGAVDITSTSTGGLINIRDAAGTSDITFDCRGTNNSYINNGGYFGVGTPTPLNPFHVSGAGTDEGGFVGIAEVVGHFAQTTAGKHSAISIDALAGQDPILYLAEDGEAMWDIRSDASDSDKLNIRYQGRIGSNVIMMTIDAITGLVNIIEDIVVDEDIGFKSGTAYLGEFQHAATAARVWMFPNKSGTVAMLDDVDPDVWIPLGPEADKSSLPTSSINDAATVTYISDNYEDLTIADDTTGVLYKARCRYVYDDSHTTLKLRFAAWLTGDDVKTDYDVYFYIDGVLKASKDISASSETNDEIEWIITGLTAGNGYELQMIIVGVTEADWVGTSIRFHNNPKKTMFYANAA